MHDLENSTTRLGNLLRCFHNNVCSSYQTFDLPTEEAARAQQKVAAAKKDGRTTVANKGKHKESASGSRKPQKFNLNTYKIHSLGGYAKAIQLFGTADGYSTQMVCITSHCNSFS